MSKPVYRHIGMKRFEQDYDHHEAIGAALELCLLGDDLDDWETNGVKEVVERLKTGYNPPVTLHGPVFAFDPATNDAGLLQMTYRRSRSLLDIAEILDPEIVVFHSSYIDRVRQFSRERWIADTAEFYLRLVDYLPGERCRIAIENIFESSPQPLASAIYEISHPRVGHCFDIGHFHMFQKSFGPEVWLKSFPGKLFHMHIHDNYGAEDLHWAPGLGAIDYEPLIDFLKTCPEPWSVTVECKDPDSNDAAVDFVRKYFPGCQE
jgi:sugar phosphate isomerase/epimerase